MRGLAATILMTLLFAVGWCAFAGTAAPLGTKDDSEGGAVRSASIEATELRACVAALQEPRTVRIEVGDESRPNIGFSEQRTFQTYGKLQADVKAAVRAMQLRDLANHKQRLAELKAKGDLRKEASLVHWIAVHETMLEQLEADAYLTMDADAPDRLWPGGVTGWLIVQSREVSVGAGKMAMLVYIMQDNAGNFLPKAVAARDQIDFFLAEDAAYRLSGQPDEVRFQVIAALERARLSPVAALDEKDRTLLAPIADIRRWKNGYEIDKQRGLIAIRP